MKHWPLILIVATATCTYSPLELEPPDCLEQGQDGCDGIDNDCDGELDEDCCETNGATRACGTNTGRCQAGERTCTDGLWSECVGEIAPEPETCADEIDHDCDGEPGCLDMDCYDVAGCNLTCTAHGTLGCGGNTLQIDTSTAENRMSWYSCLPWDETGGELVYSFSVAEPTDVNIWLDPSAPGTDVDILVLREACNTGSCIAHGDSTVDFFADQTETFYIVFDSYARRAGTVDVWVSCYPHTEVCLDGIDNDLDGTIDCDDLADCGSTSPCLGTSCVAPGPIHCNQPVWASTGTSDVIAAYDCGPAGLTGPERGWTFSPPTSGNVRFELETDSSTPLDVFLLEAACAGGACAAQSDGSAIDVLASESYFVVVDGPEGERDFSLRAICSWEYCGNGRDDNDDGLIDDADWDSPCADLSGEHCLNGHDDNGNGETDCQEDSCTNDPACPPSGACHRGNVIGCWGPRYSGSTAAETLATNVIDAYASPCSTDAMPAPEHALRFDAPASGDLVITAVAHDGEDAHIFVLLTACTGSECVVSGTNTVTATVEQGTTYFIVLDSPDRVYNFDLEIGCDFEICDQLGDEDDNGVEGCDDPACAGTPFCPSGHCNPSQITELDCAANSSASGTTAGATNDMALYSCIGYLETGGEQIYHLRLDEDTPVSIEFDQGIPLRLLEGQCRSWMCSGMSWGSPMEFVARANRDYYLVVDGQSVAYNLNLSCSVPLDDERCANGIDDDGNGSIDCADSSCDCTEETCVVTTKSGPGLESSSLGCGSAVAGTTSGVGDGALQIVTDNIDSYPCNSWSALGPEVAYSLRLDAPADVTVHLDAIAHQKWIILAGNACHPDDCIAAYGQSPVPLEADRDYLVVVDGVEDDAAGPFVLSLQCE